MSGIRFCCAALGVTLASVLLAGCAGQGPTSADRVGASMVAPGKYRFYTCAHLAQQTVALRTRERELDALIARAGTGTGGSIVSAVAYRPEYVQTRGNLIEVRKTEVEKDCPATPVVAEIPPPPAPRGKKR